MTDKPRHIPDAAIEAAARALTHELYAPVDLPCDHDYEVAEAILRAAAPHLLKEAHSAIEHLHNDVGTLTEQLNRARDALREITELADRSDAHPDVQLAPIAREVLKALEEK